nr:MAG: hypothetical protein 3 [Leviviridae sp.]
MSKSQVNALLHVSRGLCKDVLAAYPALRGIDLDIEKLALHCRNRGQAVFLLDLPALDALLLQGLETGRLQLSGPFTRRVSKRVRVPRLFSGLWLRIFDKDACLRQDVDVTALFFLRQFLRLGKNIEVECSFDRVKAVQENYHDIERRIRRPTLGWDADSVDVREKRLNALHLGECCRTDSEGPDLFVEEREALQAKRSESQTAGLWRLLDQVQQVADLVVGSMDTFDPVSYSADLEERSLGLSFKHGPGAVAEKLKQYEKSDFNNWPAKLQNTFPYEFVGQTAGDLTERPINHEKASILYCVPKTAKGPRLIAAEPASHMWCQQSTKAFLEEQIRSSKVLRGFIDFKNQSLSGDLVIGASLDRKLATVDLSDASDRLSCWTVERIFRRSPSVLSALHAARTRHLRDNITEVQSFLRLKKFATQGTAVTFPVQSIVFLCIAIGCVLDGEISWREIVKLHNRVRVYGDDIIIPRHGYERLVAVMDVLGLKVNVAKSYVRGHFRESCGTDGYLGYCVTPVSPTTLVADSPASRQAVVDTTNNLFNKGLWHASDSLRAQLPARIQRGIRIVGPRDTGFAGLTSYSGSDELHLDKRWNTRLHRYEVRVWTLLSKPLQRDRQGYAALLDFFASKYNHEHARIVSQYADTRKARDGFLWEPLNTDARVHELHLPRDSAASLRNGGRHPELRSPRRPYGRRKEPGSHRSEGRVRN